MSAPRIKKRLKRPCDLCRERSHVSVFLETNEKERAVLGTNFFEVRLCLSCAGTPGIGDRLSSFFSLSLACGDQPNGGGIQ